MLVMNDNSDDIRRLNRIWLQFEVCMTQYTSSTLELEMSFLQKWDMEAVSSIKPFYLISYSKKHIYESKLYYAGKEIYNYKAQKTKRRGSKWFGFIDVTCAIFNKK